MSQIPVSLQLYTVREDLAKDLPGTLKKIAEIGYKNVEGGGFGGLTAAEYGKIVADHNLSIPGAHVGIQELSGDNITQVLADYKSIGVKTIIIPFLSADQRDGGKGYANIAKQINAIAPKVKDAGLSFAYHNHDFEFNDKDGEKCGMDILLETTDPSLVKLELDTYWALKAGVDPVAFIKAHADRILLLHIKDMDPADKSFAPVGTGILPLDGILEAATSQVQYLVVEQDVCIKQTPLEAIEISYKTMKSKGYA